MDKLAFFHRQGNDFAAHFRADVNFQHRIYFAVGNNRFGDGMARNFFRLDGDGRRLVAQREEHRQSEHDQNDDGKKDQFPVALAFGLGSCRRRF